MTSNPRLSVYPRVCGGTLVIPTQPFSVHGLSPRVRGNPLDIGRIPENRRSIPACAGEPEMAEAWKVEAAVYPRVCGGTEDGERILILNTGLSPRVRGNPSRDLRHRRARGSIPACAGEPVLHGLTRGLPPVYPRVCGGTFQRALISTQKQGLSPRVRGNLPQIDEQSGGGGSIPACAGEPHAVTLD